MVTTLGYLSLAAMVFSLLQAPNLHKILGNMEATKAILLWRQGREAISGPVREHLSARQVLQLFSPSSTSLSVNKYLTPLLVYSGGKSPVFEGKRNQIRGALPEGPEDRKERKRSSFCCRFELTCSH